MIIGNGTVITNDEKNTFIDDGAILIKDNIIVEVGKYKDLLAKYKDEEVIDVDKRLIMPGFICAHSHIYSAYARGMNVNKDTSGFLNVLENLWWNLDKKLTLEDVKLNAYTTYIESIKNGVTTLIDHHSSPNAIEGSLFKIKEAALEIGIRTSLCYEVSDRDGAQKRDLGIKENIDFIKDCQNDNSDMIKALFGLHASFTLSDDTLYKVKEATDGLEIGFHIHVAEGIQDQFDSLEKYEKRVVQRLFDFDILNEKSIAVHCVHVNPLEMEILKHTNVNVVHNPQSNMNNAVGCPNVLRMLDMGINVGLGTDAYTNDMFDSMKCANILHKFYTYDNTVGFNETKKMQFENNPKLLRNYFKHELGIIKEGAYADVVTLSYDPITPIDENNWFGHLIFGLSGKDVNDTMVNGKFIMRDRTILTADEEKINRDSRQRAKEIWKLI